MSKSKTKYLKCKFDKREGGFIGDVTIRNITIPRVEKFGNLGFIIHYQEDIDEDIGHRKGMAKIEKCIWRIV